jgi:polyisoprenoid-binding protein YceI
LSWQIVPAHTHIQFTARHMMIRKVRGSFKRFRLAFAFDEQNPANTAVKVTIAAASIDTRDTQRDAHLRSPGFLNVVEYPDITFAGRHVRQIDARNGRLIGDLTIQDVTHEVILNVRQTTRTAKSNQPASIHFQAAANISRKAWGLEWSAALETGGWLVGDTINIDIELEIVKVQEQEAAAAQE